ncbi:hypothetical protein GCM10009765_24610 [Fodinicola feengrottensis]|uniref:Uncharacterized protein n=1 Tax=Fodinicola feengrottensis TaxID=435914 RepID=A0ABN2GNN8_9ACTN
MTASALVEQTRRRLGPVGVFGAGAGALGGIPVAEERHFVAGVERLGYGSLGVGEGVGGKDVFARLGVALAETERLVLAAETLAELEKLAPAVMGE